MENYRVQSPGSSKPEMAESEDNDGLGGMGLSDQQRRLIQEGDVHYRGVMSMQLRRVTVMCLIFNRMIGTGIFRTPATVFNYTQSVGISMLWWFMGLIVAMSGILVYMELGLTLPLYVFDDEPASVPRNGGELNYLKYIFKKPRYFVICVFGIAFILLANVATNSIAFGLSVLDAAGKSSISNSNEIVRAIAIGMVTFSCLIHTFWRRGGLYLNNILAILKISILTMIFIIGLLAYGGVFKNFKREKGALQISNSFSSSSADAYGYAEGFLAILFAFGGFNQANYVMGEINNPRLRYKWPSFMAVGIVSMLYILVNIAYFIVVPSQDFSKGITSNVAHKFFELTLGSIDSPWAPKAPRMLSAFMAISSAGNIIVMTYTAARVKQEIAKEGIIPFRAFLTKGHTFRIPSFWKSKTESMPEDVPVGALFLHFCMSILLIFATWKMTAPNTYSLLVDLYSYAIDALFSVSLGFGLLYMRLFSPRGWAQSSRNSGFAINPFISCVAAGIFGIANLFPVAAKWAPPKVWTILPIPFYTTGVVSWSIMACGVIWWLVFRFVVPSVGRDHIGKLRLVTRKLWFVVENGYKVLVYEDVLTEWVPKEHMNEGLLPETELHQGEAATRARMRNDGVRDLHDDHVYDS